MIGIGILTRVAQRSGCAAGPLHKRTFETCSSDTHGCRRPGGSQRLDLQRDVLTTAGVASEAIYEDCISGKRDDRPGLEACLKAVLRSGDMLVVWKLDRLG